jgi:hypothetical protein
MITGMESDPNSSFRRRMVSFMLSQATVISPESPTMSGGSFFDRLAHNAHQMFIEGRAAGRGWARQKRATEKNCA